MKLIELLLFLLKTTPMSNTYLSKRQFVILAFLLIAVLLRLIPHHPNFTPVTAIALFGGLYFTNKSLAYLAPLFIMVVSDLFLGFHSISIVVYAAFIFVSFIVHEYWRDNTSVNIFPLDGFKVFVGSKVQKHGIRTR